MRSWWNGTELKIELDETETKQLLAAISDPSAIKDLLTAGGLSVPIVGIVVAALTLHAAWESALIKDADKGNGVFLTQPAFPFGGLVLIPQTRCVNDLPSDWATRDSGTFASDHCDIVNWSIEHGAVGADVTAFRLQNDLASESREFRMRDGLGGEWTVQAKSGTRAENALYASQLTNGQQFTFRRPTGFLDVWSDAFSIGGIENVRGGDRVTFTWKN